MKIRVGLGFDVHQLISDFNSYFPTTIYSMEELIALLQKVSSPISDIPSPLRCAMDIALHDLCGQLVNMPARKILEVPPNHFLPQFNVGYQTYFRR